MDTSLLKIAPFATRLAEYVTFSAMARLLLLMDRAYAKPAEHGLMRGYGTGWPL